MARRAPFAITPAALVPVLLTGALVARADAPALSVRVRDSRTGAALAASIRRGAEAQTGTPQGDLVGRSALSGIARSGADGRLALAPGAGPLTVEAPGHRPLTVSLEGNDPALPVTIWLDPDEPRTAEPAMAPEAGILEGFVTDEATGGPLPGVTVLLAEGGRALTGAEGAFRIAYRPRERRDAPPGDSTLRLQRAGYRALRLDRVALESGVRRFILALAPGAGEEVRSDRHKLTRDCAELADAQTAPERAERETKSSWGAPERAERETKSSWGAPSAEPSPAPAGEFLAGDGWGLTTPAPISPYLLVVNPPASIKVGTSCSCTTCSAVDVVSLETYVARGLNDEWISSWNSQSLRAGSIAFRSYGSYYQLHPLNASYDICSTTCCQVYDTDTATATTTAAAATAGILLQKSNLVLRSEFSAENNGWDDPSDGLTCTNADLSCGDGFAGSPSTSWPCVSDSVCAGKGCFGHGRGMCQWGTQRWAISTTPQWWKWIVDHYYNANGAGTGNRTAYMTSPISLGVFSPTPATTGAGQTFTINLAATNNAGLAHSHILIGASIYSAASGYISDPAHDALVTLATGANSPSRPFSLPLSTPDGTYDLIVALWLDVDENGIITGTDLALTSATSLGALTVSTPSPGRIGSGGAPLTLAKNGASINFAWGKPCASAADYAVYQGALGSFASHAPLSCTTGGATAATLTPASGNRYYLVVPLTSTHEGSYGTNTAGAERPPAASGACRSVQHLVPLCR